MRIALGRAWRRAVGRPESLAAAPLILLSCLMPLPAVAQEGPVTFEFSFSNPGARSMGLGGAFAALADDATAAFANPAGLVQLIDPELSVEGRSGSYETPFVAGGRASGVPSGEGLDTSSGLRRDISANDRTGLSFAALVVPVKKLSLALYHHTWADFDISRQVDGLFAEVDGEVERGEDVRARTRFEVVNTGLAGAWKATPKLSFGLGVVYYQGRVSSLSREFAHDEEALFEPSPFTVEGIDTVYSYEADDRGINLHGGFLWRATPQWSFGGYYREGPKLSLRVVETAGQASEEPPGTVELDAITQLKLPDVYGLGAAYRTRGGAWTLTFEWTRVEYSSITDSLDTTIFDADQIALDDGDELHLGVEYVIVRSRPVVGLRLGAWSDPAHSVGSGPEADVFEQAIFQTGEDDIHFAAGLGLVFEKFQIDLGADISDQADLLSLSFVYRF